MIRPLLSPVLLTVLVPALFACKGEPESAPDPKPAKPDLTSEAAAANAEIPDALKGKLEFEAKEVDEGEVLAVVPKGWPESEFIPGKFAPPGSEIGDRVDISVGTNCDGACTAKDWKAVVDKVEFGGQPDAFTVETDEPIGEHGRLVVYVGGDEVHIRAAWWKPDASRYVMCRADLDATWSPAKAAFIRACKATVLVDWG